MPAPYNDNFASAAAISGTGSVSDTTVGATVESGEPVASYVYGVWYLYTAAVSGVHKFETTAYGGTPMFVAAYDGAAGFPSTDDRMAYYQPGDTSDISGSTPNITLYLTNGQTVYILVKSFSVGRTFTLAWTETVTPPTGNDFSSPITITPSASVINVDTTNATPDISGGEPSPGAWNSRSHKTVWLKFTAPITANYVVKHPTSYSGAARMKVYKQTGSGYAGLVDLLSGGLVNFGAGSTFSLTAGDVIYVDVIYPWDDTLPVYISMGAFCIDAITDPNSGSSSVTVLGDAVRETQKTDYLAAFAGGEDLDQGAATPAFWVRGANLPPPGKYTVTVQYRRNTVDQGGWTIFLRLNGQIIAPVQDSLITVTSTLTTRDLTGQTTRQYGPDTFPIYASTDVIEVVAQNDYISGTPDGIEITKVCFTQVDSTPPPKPRLYPATMPEPEVPLGSSSYDAAFDNTGKHPDTKDMVVTGNGDVYVFAVGRLGTANYGSRFYKYDATAGTWSTIDGDVWGHGNPNMSGRQCWNSQLATDGTDVWMSWGEQTTVAAGSLFDWVWRCKKYDTGANTFTELGTGQAYYTHVGQEDIGGGNAGVVQAGSYDDDGAGLWIGPDGKLWAAWVEENPNNFNVFSDFSGSATNLNGVGGFSSLDGSNPAARDGSGNAVGTAAGESGSYFTPTSGTEVTIPGGKSSILEIAALPTSTDWIAYEWSITGQGTGTRTYYRIIIKPSNDVEWQRVNAGVVTVLKTYTAPTTWAIGDRINIQPFTGNVNCYYRKAAGPSWVYMGAATTDPSPLSDTLFSAISFNGTSGKWAKLLAGNTLRDQRPVVWYWSGSAWVDTALELIPGGFRRSPTGQTVGTVKNSENARHVQLTFCHADGPNNNPSVFYSTEHSAPGLYPGYENQELQLHYNEFNGSTWGTCVTQGTYGVWGSQMYEGSNTAPNYYASNGFPQGFSLFTLDGSPHITMCVITHINAVDLVGMARMASDRSGFVGTAGDNPDDPIRMYAKSSGGGPWGGGNGPGLSTMVDSKGQVFLWVMRVDDQFGGWLLMRGVGGDPIGTGSNWGIGALINPRITYTEFDSYDKLYIGADDSVYVLMGTSGGSLQGSYVFKWDPTGLILGALSLSRVRFRAFQDAGI